MAVHSAKRTRPAEEVEVDPPEDLGAVLDRELWPSLRERCEVLLRERAEAEAQRARKAAEAEYASRLATLQAREAAAEAALRAAEEMRAALEAEREALSHEKQRMAAGKHMDDILTLNIGGEKTVSVQRKTLCLVEDSMLASSFSGRWDESLVRDADGAIFVDFRPELFMPLLDYLRARRIQDPETPVLMPTVQGSEEAFQTMLKYYGLETAGRSPPVQLSFTFVPPVEGLATKRTRRSPAPARGELHRSSTGRTFEVREDGLVATRATGSHWKRLFGSASVNRSALARPVVMRFRIGAMGELCGKDRCGPGGPNLGIAASSLERSSDDSNVRKPQGVWVYRAADGALLAPVPADIVGPEHRAPAAVGDLITLTLYKDGTMGLAKNREDQGIVFCNLPDSVKPVVEMNIRYTQVCIMP